MQVHEDLKYCDNLFPFFQLYWPDWPACLPCHPTCPATRGYQGWGQKLTQCSAPSLSRPGVPLKGDDPRKGGREQTLSTFTFFLFSFSSSFCFFPFPDTDVSVFVLVFYISGWFGSFVQMFIPSVKPPLCFTIFCWVIVTDIQCVCQEFPADWNGLKGSHFRALQNTNTGSVIGKIISVPRFLHWVLHCGNNTCSVWFLWPRKTITIQQFSYR